MAGVGKLLKQAQKMQKQMEAVQAALAKEVLTVSSGGGAIRIKISGQGEFLSIEMNPDFLQEDTEFVEDTLLAAVREAATKAKEKSENAMGNVKDAMSGFSGII